MNRSDQPNNKTPYDKTHYDTKNQSTGNQQHILVKLSPPSLCSYIPERLSQLAFIVVEDDAVDTLLYSQLSHSGFRRSGNAIYKPHCAHCMQCISSRVIVNDFKPSRRFRKTLNRNAHVTLSIKPAHEASQEHYSLYQRYISNRHADGDMYPPSLQTFEQFLVSSPADTVFMEFREPNGRLIAVAVTDKLSNGLSSIYTFFDPDPSFNSRSLGVFCILKQIQLAKDLNLPYVYLGFWIPSVKKMNYKTDYAPIELLINNQWQRFDKAPNHNDILDMLQTHPVRIQPQNT